MQNGNKWNDIQNQSVNGSDTHAAVNLGQSYDWVMMPDYNTVTAAKEKIEEVLK